MVRLDMIFMTIYVHTTLVIRVILEILELKITQKYITEDE